MCKAIEDMKQHSFEDGKAATLYELTHKGKLDKAVAAADMLNISIDEYSIKEAAFFNN